MSKDIFAEIAASGMGGRSELLYEPGPLFDNIKPCTLAGEREAIETTEKMATVVQMKEELIKMKEAYTPYLSDFAPQLTNFRKKVVLNEFVLNGKETITLPHYGGPTGNAKQTYEGEFVVEAIPDDECLYLCFKGVDYKAAVLVNSEFAGSHEGFFSPFEMDITDLVKEGSNQLKIVVKNDFCYGGNKGEAVPTEGDKLYAATGLGWDGPEDGWHHCPPGMGIYGEVYLEYRNRLHIRDLFVRPIWSEHRAEAWIEVENTEYQRRDVTFQLSVYGQNFEHTMFENKVYIPETVYVVGMGDSLTEADVKDIIGKGLAIPAQKGMNLYKFSFPMEDTREWNLETPFLYQLQVQLCCDGQVTDNAKRQFGMREFRQDTENTPKGMLYLNNRKIRLRGANTMGFEQQDVLRGDYEQLVEDILLAKLCNMNFWRITQRPVQEEVYDYCDRLGLMVQTDLPLFGCMRRNKVAEGIKQAEEMERLIRSHPSCVIVSYINEPFPNAQNEPHRHLERKELEQFFSACDFVVHLNNPDRVIKHVDGDYDPPTEGMPDNHCYTTWYNGHGIDIGKLHKGYWMQVKPDWYYGCGEFGAEGLECAEVMKKYYPKEWLVGPFDPRNIVGAQTGDMHYFFFDTQDTMEDWIRESQQYQALATRFMTEAFRRDSRMISQALHLFIDAWPSGWMKTIMDCDRNPKQAWFAYRNALEPVLISLRTDRFTYYAGEEVSIEVFVCNDTSQEGEDYKLCYELYTGEKLILGGEEQVLLKNCDVTAVSDVRFIVPKVSDREIFVLKAILLDGQDTVITHNSISLEIFEDYELNENSNVIFIEDLEPGEHEIAGEIIKVKECGMLPLHFVSRKSGHEVVSKFRERDFAYWYDKKEDRITPLLYKTFIAQGFQPLLLSGNRDEDDNWKEAFAAAVKEYEGKLYVICLVKMRLENPVAKRFLREIYEYAKRHLI